MATVRSWAERRVGQHAAGEDVSEGRKRDFKLPHHRVLDGRVRVVLEGVRSAMNILAATRFQPGGYQLKIPAGEVREVYEHLAVHLEEFDQEPPAVLDGWEPADGWPPDQTGA